MPPAGATAHRAEWHQDALRIRCRQPFKKVCQNATGTATETCGQTRLFTYDNLGFLRSEQHPEKTLSATSAVTYTDYDARGHVGRKQDGTVWLKYFYDGAERLTGVYNSNASGAVGSAEKLFTYGIANSGSDLLKGKLIQSDRFNRPLLFGSVYNATVRELFTYAGPEGRVSQKENRITFNGTTNEFFRQSYLYDSLGLVSSLTYPDCVFPAPGVCAPAPRTVAFPRAVGRLSAVTGYASNFTYHSNGLLAGFTHSNNVTFTQAKDSSGMARPLSLSSAVGATPYWGTGAYGYDGAGNIKAMGAQQPTYDTLSRVKFSGMGESYTYDIYGNRTAVTTGSTTVLEPTSLSTNRLTGAAVYDDAGNLTSWNGASYEYDKFNMMKRFVSGTEEWLYMYTANDERFWAFKVQPAGVPRFDRYTLRDLDGKVLREYANSGYAWGGYEDYIYRDGSLLASVLSTGEQRHFDLDHLGSVRLVTNASAANVGTHQYQPYGKEQTTIQEADRMKFAGHQRDLGSLGGATPDQDDLDYMHARHYSPVTGRFLSTDPIDSGSPGQPQSWNRYSYVSNNPLSFVDPDGRLKIRVNGEGYTLDFETSKTMIRWEKYSKYVLGGGWLKRIVSGGQMADEFLKGDDFETEDSLDGKLAMAEFETELRAEFEFLMPSGVMPAGVPAEIADSVNFTSGQVDLITSAATNVANKQFQQGRISSSERAALIQKYNADRLKKEAAEKARQAAARRAKLKSRTTQR